MRKALRIISITAGLISVVSAVILGFIYLEDVVGHIKNIKTKYLLNFLKKLPQSMKNAYHLIYQKYKKVKKTQTNNKMP